MPMQWIIAAVIAAILIYAIIVFNRLVRQRNVVREGWSGIDVQLRRRADLVPNLVEAVKAYAAHERNLFEELAQQRASSLTATGVSSQAATQNALAQSLGRLIALAEAYPDLKANQNFLKLQDELTEIEDQIQMARRYYNGAARNLNVTIQSFPDGLVARLSGFKAAEFFELDDPREAAAPQVVLVGAKS